jgi:phenylpyruvate tautomerase PptA (4-oxalocrotonate tautomerase family)
MRFALTASPAFALLMIHSGVSLAQNRGQRKTESAPVVTARTVGWPATPICAIPTDEAPVRRTLPLDVLDRLEEMSSSAFVQAFLIQFIAADSQPGSHRLARCARNFLATPLSDVPDLRLNYPDVGGIVAALRTAETARLRTIQLADSVRTIGALLQQFQVDGSMGNFEALARALKSLAGVNCHLGAQCSMLDSAMRLLDATLNARRAAETAAEATRQAMEALSAAEAHVNTVESAHASDSLHLARLTARVDSTAKSDTARRSADAAVVATFRQDSAKWASVDTSAKATRNALKAAADTAQAKQQLAEQTANALLQNLGADVERLRAAVESAKQDRNPISLVGSTPVDGGVQAHLDAPPPAMSEHGATVTSSSIAVALTDFIIARAKREAVNAFIVNLHTYAIKEPLLQTSFPDTWSLMRDLPTRGDGNLDAVAVGRIPLTAWRATLASDFATLPVSLLQDSPVGFCGTAATTSQSATGRRVPPAKAESTLRAQAATLAACQGRFAMLRSLAPFAARLLDGDPVLHVLRDADHFVLAGGPQLPPEWRRVAEGASVLSSLAQVYEAQGHVPSADPARHPYILSSRALIEVPEHQRDAFERLLVVRAIGTAQDVPLTIDVARFLDAVATATQLLDRITAQLASADTGRVVATTVVREAFSALVSATDVASALTKDNAGNWLDSTRTRWREFSGVVEPLTARDFGLALSRVTVLVRDLRGTDVPAPVITFAALASTLSQAQNSDQMQLAFENAASPIGGWQAKRYGEGGFSINAFPGGSFAWEKLIRENNSDPTSIAKFSKTAGITLPVGFEWLRTSSQSAGTSTSGCFLLVCNVGLFVPVIDLGAVLSYRLAPSDTVERSPNATIQQVFSPGIYVDLPLTRTVPINILAGMQLMPALRRLTTPETADRSAVHFGVALSMDLQLFRF